MTRLADLTADAQMDATRVRRRHVFYLSGFDPRGAAHYHRLYRDEAARQAKVNGLEIAAGPRRKAGPNETRWTLQAAGVTTVYSFLHYDDLMRRRWARTNWTVLRDILRYSAVMLRRGMFWKILRLSWPSFLAFGYPLALLLSGLLAAALAGLAGATFGGWTGGLAVFAAACAALLRLRPWLEHRGSALWIARILSFMCDKGARREHELEGRLDDWARIVAAVAETGEIDEVLLVGHSIGSQLAASLAARVARLCAGRGARLSLLTLGQLIPLQAMQPDAQAARDELQLLANDEAIDWIDVSAAIDSACFPLCDPLAACGLAQPDPAGPKPKLVSAQFQKLFSPQGYAGVKKEFRRAHFQYLMSAELPGDYDYFLITAGDMTLARRFAHRKSANFTRFRLGGS